MPPMTVAGYFAFLFSSVAIFSEELPAWVNLKIKQTNELQILRISDRFAK